MNDQEIIDSQQGLKLEDVNDRFNLLQHHVNQFSGTLSDTDQVVNMIRKGMSLASNVAADLEELGESSLHGSLEDMVKTSIDLENTTQQQKAAFMKLRADVIERRLEVGDGMRQFDEYFEQSMQQYNNTTDKQKYHEHEKYVEFKQMVWSVKNPDDPMPTLDYDQNGRDTNDNDDDVVATATKKSLKCPLTMTWFESPVTSKLCKHTFSKNAIMGLIQRSSLSQVECPIPGCRQAFDQSSFYDDTLMERMVSRAKEAEERNVRTEQFHDVV